MSDSGAKLKELEAASEPVEPMPENIADFL